jgi:hypothetical protein
MTFSANFWPGGRNFSRPFVFLLSFSLIFLYAVSPTVYSGDSGLFTAASYFLGSAHPPGYPLYVLLGKLATFLPFGNIALKVNLLAALFGALAILIAYDTVRYLTKNPLVSLFAPLAILSSPLFILQASQAKGVYTLNAFLLMSIFYLCLKALREENFLQYLLISSFLLGLGISNHHTIGVMLVVMLYVAIVRRKELPSATIPLGLTLFILGLSVYLYLYLRTITDGFITYSKVYSLSAFLKIFFRSGYSADTVQAVQGSIISSSFSGWFHAVRNFGTILSKEIHPIVWIFVLFGLIGIFSERRTFWYFVISCGIWLPMARIFIALEHPTYNDLFTVSPYFLPLIPILAVIAATGMYKFFEKIKIHLPLAARGVTAGVMVFQLIYIPLAFQKSSLSDYFLPYTWIKDTSKVFKTNSFYFAFGDNPAFLNFYALGVERLRDDVFCLDSTPDSSNFRLSLAPAWKFSAWYPEFYETTVSPATYFYPIARQGRLYASSISSIPDSIKEKFDAGLYVLVVMLKPKDFILPIDERFKEDFAKIDYLPVLYSHKPDYMAEEILYRYVNAILTYAYLLAEENEKDADFYYRVALVASGRLQKITILESYIPFLLARKNLQEARHTIDELKRTASEPELRKIEELEKGYKGKGYF